MGENDKTNNVLSDEEISVYLTSGVIPEKFSTVLLQALEDSKELKNLKLKERVEAGMNRVSHLLRRKNKDDFLTKLREANPNLVKDGKLTVSEDDEKECTFLVFKKGIHQLKVQLLTDKDEDFAGDISSASPIIEPNNIDLAEQYELLKDFFTLYKKAYPKLKLDELTGFSEPKQ